MTENEAIGWIKKIYIDTNQPDRCISLKMAISALIEIQQYRATGLSPSMVEDLKRGEKRAHKIAVKHAMKLEEYQKLGTVEELREARKKKKENKPIRVLNDRTDGCPICKRAFYEKVNFCPDCGQSIDWS